MVKTIDIIIEKAEKTIRGLYQFLIKTNLVFHNINTEYVERGDDGGIELLNKSKISYYPIIISERFAVMKSKILYKKNIKFLNLIFFLHFELVSH